MESTAIIKLQEEIESTIESAVNQLDGHQVLDKLQILSTLLATASMCIVESKRNMLKKRGEWLRKHAEKVSTYSPSIAKEYANTACIDEEMLFVRCERNYSAITHAIDALRSILSYLKQELRDLQM